MQMVWIEIQSVSLTSLNCLQQLVDWEHILLTSYLNGAHQSLDRLEHRTITGGLRLGRSEVLRSLRHYTCGHKAKDITPSIDWRREA